MLLSVAQFITRGKRTIRINPLASLCYYEVDARFVCNKNSFMTHLDVNKLIKSIIDPIKRYRMQSR